MNKKILEKIDFIIKSNKYEVIDVTEYNYTENTNRVYEIKEKNSRLKALLTIYPNITERVFCTESKHSIFTKQCYEELNSFIDSILREEE